VDLAAGCYELTSNREGDSQANAAAELFNNPVEDYTRELIEAVPGRNIQLNL